MDPFSHAALGRTLVALAPPGRSGRALALAGTLGALSPDIDAVFMPFGWDVYLLVHEIGTHSAVGTFGCAALTASVIHRFARDQAWRWLAGAAWLGAASHVLLDLLSSARLRILWPFSGQQVSIPLVAMADPWLAGILVAGAGALALASRWRQRVAVCVIAVAAAFLLMKAVMAARAIDAYRGADARNARVMSRVVEARWAALSQWHIFDRESGHLRAWRISGTSGDARLVLSWPVGTQGPRIAASRALPAVRNFLRVHDLTFAATVNRPDDREWVLWSDIRYCWNPDAADAPQLEPIVGAASGRLACALWFGGEFDRRGSALLQLVKIAGFTQTRAVVE